MAPGESLQAAIVTTRPGGVIRLRPGRHQGPVVVPVADLTLVGDPGAVLDGGRRGTVLTVQAPRVTVRGLRLSGTGTSPYGQDAAIRLVNAPDGVVEGNTADGVFFGIVAERSSRCRIVGNRLRGGAAAGRYEGWGDGIRLFNSPDNQVVGNAVSRFRDGLYFEFSNRSRISGNSADDNRRYGLHFMFMDDSRFQKNRFRRNQAGCVLMWSRRIRVDDNVFAANQGPVGQGILFKENNDGKLRRNRILDNTVGLFVEGSTRNEVEGNLVAGNGWGVLLFSSSIDNRFTGNRFIGNGYDLAVDMPRSRNRFSGNYWDRYRGYDLDADGIGDEPFAPVSVFAFMTMQFPDLYAFAGSPAMQALDYAQRQLPALSPSQLRDARPLMRVEPSR